MADNVTLPASTGTFAAASDDVGGVQFQKIKIDLGGDGVSSPLVKGRNAAAESAGVVLSTEDLAQLAAIVTAVNAVTTATGIVPTNGRTTREYVFANGVRLASVTATASTALPTLGATREVRISASAAAYINLGTSVAVTATIGATSLRLEAGDREVIAIPAGMTHFAAIRDTADGFVHLTPVA